MRHAVKHPLELVDRHIVKLEKELEHNGKPWLRYLIGVTRKE